MGGVCKPGTLYIYLSPLTSIRVELDDGFHQTLLGMETMFFCLWLAIKHQIKSSEDPSLASLDGAR